MRVTPVETELDKKVKALQVVTKKSREEVLEECVDLYFEVHDIKYINSEGIPFQNEIDRFKNLVYSCGGSRVLKGRLIGILQAHSIYTQLDFVNAGIDRMMNFNGVGDGGRELLREMVKKTIDIPSGKGVKVLSTRL